uniref:Uncharacterized protein n=1 Tax=Rhizophora mucronata TaxID=61149 RepID=A0A2P2LKP2_RHIMU
MNCLCSGSHLLNPILYFSRSNTKIFIFLNFPYSPNCQTCSIQERYMQTTKAHANARSKKAYGKHKNWKSSENSKYNSQQKAYKHSQMLSSIDRTLASHMKQTAIIIHQLTT